MSEGEAAVRLFFVAFIPWLLLSGLTGLPSPFDVIEFCMEIIFGA